VLLIYMEAPGLDREQALAGRNPHALPLE